jgi:hypothetical protein
MPLQSTFDQNKIGNEYFACNQAAVTLSGLSNTATGLILVNPVGSTINIAVMATSWAFSTAPAGASIVGWAMSPTPSSTAVTLGTPMTVYSGKLTGATTVAQGKACSAATTVGTPVWARMMGGPVAASQINPPFLEDDVAGEIILVPGTSIQLAFLTTAAVGMGTVTWIEYTPPN